MSDYDVIVVATDLSDPSFPAVRHAGKLAERLGSKLVLTYVMEPNLPPMVAAFSSDSEAEIFERHKQHAQKLLDDCVVAQLPGRDVEAIVLKGPTHHEIVRLARERNASMIVVGMQGHGFLTHALMGNTAERILHAAPCPVLVVGHNH